VAANRTCSPSGAVQPTSNSPTRVALKILQEAEVDGSSSPVFIDEDSGHEALSWSCDFPNYGGDRSRRKAIRRGDSEIELGRRQWMKSMDQSITPVGTPFSPTMFPGHRSP